MNGKILLLVICVSAGCALVLSAIQKKRNKKSGKKLSKHIVVMLPETVLFIGVIGLFTALAVLFGFTFLSAETPHWLFYAIFGAFVWLYVYLIVKTMVFRVVLKEQEIEVFPVFAKPYTFTFQEIDSAVHQVKQNRTNSERLIIKTKTGKKVTVESGEIGYKQFLHKIMESINVS